MSLTKVTNSMVKEASISVLDFGAVGDFNYTTLTGTDNYAAFVAALAKSQATGLPLDLGGSKNSYYLETGININLLTTPMIGRGATLVFATSVPIGIRIVTIGVANTWPTDNASRDTGGFKVICLADNGIGMVYGNATFTANNVSVASIRNITIEMRGNSATAIQIAEDAWGIETYTLGVKLLGAANIGINYPAGVVNSGERVFFRNVDFAADSNDSTAILSDNPQLELNFDNTSFTVPRAVLARNGAKVYIQNSHFETVHAILHHVELDGSPAGAVGTHVVIRTSSFNFNNGIVNDPALKAPFSVGTLNTVGPHTGLVLDNCTVSWLPTDTVKGLIVNNSSPGIVQLNVMPSLTFDRMFTGPQYYCESRNLCSDPYFSGVSIVDWAVDENTGGTPPVLFADPTSPGGINVWRWQAATANTHSYFQNRVAKPGDQALFVFQVRRNSLQTNAVSVIASFLNSQGVVLASVTEFLASGSSTGFEWISQNWLNTQIAPQGTAQIQIKIRITATTSGSADFGYVHFDTINAN
jgi:hypothetical protein